MKLFHTADIHLGRRRLDGRLPDSDFADAFEHLARAAISEKSDVFLLCGDLFDRPQVDPPHLRQAQRILSLLKKARIPVVAIEGNHDKAFLSSGAPTWLDYLAQDDLLILLKTPFDATGPLLAPWDLSSKHGSWIEIAGIRFTGAGYLGAATPHKVRQIVEKLEADRTHVLLMHAGPDYFVGEGGGFSADDLQLIRAKVRYLALGHIHKPMLHGGWACNPGSPENCELRETLYDRDTAGNAVQRGYACVELDPTDRTRPPIIAVRSNPRRPCFQIDLDCSPFGNKLKDGAAALEKAAARLIAASQVPMPGAVELRLTGRINLNRIALDSETLGRNLEQAAGIAAVSVNPSAINLDALAEADAGDGGTISRENLERAALRHLVNEEHLWGLDGEQEAIANLFYDLKEAIHTGRSTQELAETIRSSPLVEKIRVALTTPPAARAAAAAPVEEGPPAA